MVSIQPFYIQKQVVVLDLLDFLDWGLLLELINDIVE